MPQVSWYKRSFLVPVGLALALLGAALFQVRTRNVSAQQIVVGSGDCVPGNTGCPECAILIAAQPESASVNPTSEVVTPEMAAWLGCSGIQTPPFGYGAPGLCDQTNPGYCNYMANSCGAKISCITGDVVGGCGIELACTNIEPVYAQTPSPSPTQLVAR